MTQAFNERGGTSGPNEAAGRSALGRLRRLRSRTGILLVEVMVAAGVLAMVIVAGTHALLTANRMAAASRVWTGARAAVQRNIDTALTVTFTQASTPAILAFTPANGQSVGRRRRFRQRHPDRRPG